MARGTKNKTVLKLVILAIALQEVGGGAVAPAMAAIIADNPEWPATTLMMIQTAPYIACIFISPIYGLISKKVKTRTLAFGAIALFIAAGAGPFLVYSSIPAVIAFRVLFGVAIGILVPMAVGLCTDFFEGRERAFMIGMVQAVACIGGMIFQTAGGYLCLLGWQYCFLIYLISIPILIFAFFALPEPKIVEDTPESIEERKIIANLSFKEKFPPIIWLYYIEIIFFMVTILIMVVNLSIMVEGEGLGTSVETGYILSAHSFFGFVGGLIFGKVYGALKKWTIPVAIILAVACWACIFFAQNLAMVAIGAALVGVMPSLVLCGTWNQISNTVVPAFATIAISLCVSCQYIGQSIEPYVLDFFSGVFGVTLGRGSFAVAIGICVVLAVVTLIQSALTKNPEDKRAYATLEQD